jgi:hypothetical protein
VARTRTPSTLGLTDDPISKALYAEGGVGDADGVAGLEDSGVVLGAVAAEAVGGTEGVADAFMGDASGVPPTAAPPQAVRTTAITSTKLRLRMGGPYTVSPAA